MIRRYRFDLLCLAAAVAFSRFFFRSHDLYDLDSVNFALGMGRFDPRTYQPHPPGYFLYVCMGRLLNVLCHDANLALVLLSVLASCGVVVILFMATLDWFGLRAARFAGLLFLISPLGWFHGTVALTYSVEAFFSALIGYMSWRMHCGERWLIVPTSIVLGVSAGVRPSSLLFLGPLFLFSMHRVPLKRQITGVFVLVLAVAAWFLPMIRASGGLSAYFGALLSLWQLVPSKDTVFNSSPATSIARLFVIGFIYLLYFGAAAIVPFGIGYGTAPVDRQKRIFTIVWIAPALCFFSFVFLKFVNSGYLMLLVPPACIWFGHWMAEWYEHAALRKPLKDVAIAGCCATNVVVFLLAPLYFSHRSVRNFEAELAGIEIAVPHVASAKDTLIVGLDSHFLGFRHAGYYLPGYLTMEYPEVRLREGTRIFAMQGRDTHLLTELPMGTYSRFMLFPLPAGDPSYEAYFAGVRGRLPAQDLRTVHLNGHDFVTGPISDLRLLFPEVAAEPRTGVYAALHSAAGAVNSRSH